jgi:hypothetical protein
VYCEALEERLQLMMKQQADIQNSIATTLKTIEEINRHAVQHGFHHAQTESFVPERRHEQHARVFQKLLDVSDVR